MEVAQVVLGSLMGKLGSLGDRGRKGLFPKSSSQWHPLGIGEALRSHGER